MVNPIVVEHIYHERTIYVFDHSIEVVFSKEWVSITFDTYHVGLRPCKLFYKSNKKKSVKAFMDMIEWKILLEMCTLCVSVRLHCECLFSLINL